MNYWNWTKQKLTQKSTIAQIMGIVFLGFLWDLIAYSIGLYSIFPKLTQLLNNTFVLFVHPDFYITLGATLARGSLGFIISFALSLIAAIASSQNSFIKHFFQPIVVVFRSIPIIAIVLIAMLWFNNNLLPVFIAFFSMFPIMYQSILGGLEHTDKKLVEMAKVFAKTKLEIFSSIYLPSARGLMLDGLKTALGFGWRAVIIGEVLAQPMRGIGTKMKEAQAFINISELIAWTVVAIIISFIFDKLLLYIGNLSTNKKLTTHALTFIKVVKNDTLTLKFENLHKKYDNKTIFDNFDTAIDNNKKHLLKWASGTGKTTLLHMVANIVAPDKGNISFAPHQKASVAYSFQDLRLLPWKNATENIMFGCQKHMSHEQKIALANHIIDQLELQNERKLLAQQMSGGQQQRVALGRALAAQSDILLLDEPLNGLDEATKHKTFNFIIEWTASYKPLIIWSTHENISANNLEGASEIILHNYTQND